MPFGPNCEYADMAECVRRNQGKDNPEAWCAELMRKTEGQCAEGATSGLPDRRLRLARPLARQGQSWYRIANKAGEVAEVYIYDEIGWWGTTAQRFVDELREITADRIDLHLNSPGGDAWDGIAIYNALLDHDARVEVHVDGLAASAASFIAQAGDRVVMAANAQMMIHKAFGLCIGNDDDMEQMRDMLRKASANIASIYAARSGVGDVDEWLGHMAAETWYGADEAVAAGLADEARTTPKRGEGDSERPEDRWDLSVFNFQGRRLAPAPDIRQATRRPPLPGDVIPDPGAGAEVAAADGDAATSAASATAPNEGATAADLGDVFTGLPDKAFTGIGDALEDALDPVGGYDPQTLSTTILDIYADAPAPPPVDPAPPRPRTTITVDELVDAIQEGVRP